MSKRPKRAPTGELFTMHPTRDPYATIWREPGSEGIRLHHHYANAARRLADSWSDDPSHEILLPWLYLSRHAVELALKYVIAEATHLRLVKGHADPCLDREAVARRLQHTQGHSIAALVTELDTHLAALGHGSFGARASRILAAIDSTDPAGEAFRYSGTLPDAYIHMDFPDLADDLNDAFDIVDAVDTMLDEDLNAHLDNLEHDEGH